MSQYAPHLLLHTKKRPSPAAALLRDAGYVVSMIDSDESSNRSADDPDVDGVVFDVPAVGAIGAVRKITSRYGSAVALLVITQAADAVRRALPSIRVMKPSEVSDDLISTIDLALAAQQMLQTG
jgi:hypothetical protein